MERVFANELINFLYESPTAFHAVKNVKDTLEFEGFKELKEADRWNLEVEGKYFVTKNDSALIAFRVGKGDIAENNWCSY